MVDHELEFGWLERGQQASAAMADGRMLVVTRLDGGQLAALWGPDRDPQPLPDERVICMRLADGDEIRQQEEGCVDECSHLQMELAAQAVNCAALEAEVRRLRAELERLMTETYCAYCGERFPLDDHAATQVTAHIATCPKHPMRAVEAERDQLKKLVTEAQEIIAEDVRRTLNGR